MRYICSERNIPKTTFRRFSILRTQERGILKHLYLIFAENIGLSLVLACAFPWGLDPGGSGLGSERRANKGTRSKGKKWAPDGTGHGPMGQQL